MYYLKSKIKKISLNQLNGKKLERAYEAFNGLSQLFGNDFLSKIFINYKYPSEIMYITELWENWKLVEFCKNSEEILKRWKNGIYGEGIFSELFIFALLVKMG